MLRHNIYNHTDTSFPGRHKRRKIGIISSHWKDVGANCVSFKYLEFTRNALDACPLIIPVGMEAGYVDYSDIKQIIQCVDGLLLTGGNSNIRPNTKSNTGLSDEARDYVALKAVEICLDLRKPVFGICRGLQEINVALGGEVGDLNVPSSSTDTDHMYIERDQAQTSYEKRHPIVLEKAGRFFGWMSLEQETAHCANKQFTVNSQHSQGITKLADVLQPEAYSEDGIIEAISHRDPTVPIFGVQWHPEWQWKTSILDQVILSRFLMNCHMKEVTNG